MRHLLLVFTIGTLILSAVTSLTVAPASGPEIYRLDTGDTIRITVWGHEDLTAQVTVAPDGLISLPLIGEIQVRGLALAELEKLVAGQLAEFVREPRVTAALAARRQISVKVFGQVNRPGAFLVYPEASIAELVAMAGGPAKRAALEKVQLLRGGDPNNAEVYPQGKGDKFGEDAAVRGPQLADGDVIFVPETKKIDWERVFFFLGGLLTLKELVKP